jgi:putative thioredoxin
MLGLRPNTPPASGAPDAVKGGLIKDGTDASFLADVVEESRNQPVIVDFWATWCGPCRQLTPALEKAVTAAKGAVKLVKIDIDKNPAFAGQLRVQSIPTVYAFKDGQPVDGFMGALPESQVKAFIDKLGGADAGRRKSKPCCLAATESLGLRRHRRRGQAYAQVLQTRPAEREGDRRLARALPVRRRRGARGRDPAMAPADSKDASSRACRGRSSWRQRAGRRPRAACSSVSPPTRRPRCALRAGEARCGRGRMEEAVDQPADLVRTTAPGTMTLRASSCSRSSRPPGPCRRSPSRAAAGSPPCSSRKGSSWPAAT